MDTIAILSMKKLGLLKAEVTCLKGLKSSKYQSQSLRPSKQYYFKLPYSKNKNPKVMGKSQKMLAKEFRVLQRQKLWALKWIWNASVGSRGSYEQRTVLRSNGTDMKSLTPELGLSFFLLFCFFLILSFYFPDTYPKETLMVEHILFYYHSSLTAFANTT